MSKYIDTDKLKEKVRFARDNFYKQVDINPKDEASLFCGMYCDALLQQIQSLQQEQPEMDLEKEIEKCLKQYNMLAVGKKDFTDIARHFAEWGATHLNARKEE